MIIVWCLLVSYITTHAEISFTDIKGMYNDIIDDKKHLSPVHGFNWYKTNIIENMYRYGNEHDATIQLIKELFHLEPDGVTFNITKAPLKPASYFTTATIGKILNYFETTKDIKIAELANSIAQDIGYIEYVRVLL